MIEKEKARLCVSNLFRC